MALTWVSADLRTGALLADLTTVACDWPLRRTIGQYDTATAHLYLDGAPPDWERAVMEGGAVLAVYDDDDPAHSIVWAGYVTQQTRDTTKDCVDLSLATIEAYLDRRTVGDVTFSQYGQNLIIAELVDRFVVDGLEPGIPLAVAYDGPGALRDRTYLDADNASVYARAQQLSQILGGPEFTAGWSWSDDGEFLLPTLYVADRIGRSIPAGQPSADATFDMGDGGCVVSASQTRDYSAGRGANKVTAFASPQGDEIPTSGPVVAANFGGRPTFEHRWTPSTSITDPLTLQQYAQQALRILAPGARALSLVADLETAPQLGVDWQLGDEVAYQIGGLDDNGRDMVPAFPGGLAGTGRVIAYELGEATITPVLAEAEIYTEESE